MADQEIRPDAMRIASAVRPAMTSLYVTYFRHAQHSDLSGPQLSVLSRLEMRGPMRISQLADEEGVRLPTASNTVNQLEKRNLVHRVRSTDDRRGVCVELTDFGRDELERVGAERTRYLAEMLSSLDGESLDKLEGFAEVMDKLAAAYVEGENP